MASIRPGEAVRIERILFDGIREGLRALGVGEGDVVLCSEATTSVWYLETTDGREVVVDLERARFVQVGTLGEADSSTHLGSRTASASSANVLSARTAPPQSLA